jgi:hypothetical protein
MIYLIYYFNKRWVSRKVGLLSQPFGPPWNTISTTTMGLNQEPMVELPQSLKKSIWPMSNEIHHFKGRKKIVFK